MTDLEMLAVRAFKTRVSAALKKLSPAQAYQVRVGSLSGDFTMATVRALIRKGIMHHRIDSPNGRCGPVELTAFGSALRAHLIKDQADGEMGG